MRRGVGNDFTLGRYAIVHEHIPRLFAVNIESFSEQVARLFEVAQAAAMILKTEIAGKALRVTARDEQVVFADIVAQDGEDGIAVVAEHLRTDSQEDGSVAGN